MIRKLKLWFYKYQMDSHYIGWKKEKDFSKKGQHFYYYNQYKEKYYDTLYRRN